jgi:hypothetical protein
MLSTFLLFFETYVIAHPEIFRGIPAEDDKKSTYFIFHLNLWKIGFRLQPAKTIKIKMNILFKTSKIRIAGPPGFPLNLKPENIEIINLDEVFK